MPRLVLVRTTWRVAAMASNTVPPMPRDSAASIAGEMATALAAKSRNVRSSKSAPRCTLPTFGAAASNRQASVAHWPSDRRVAESVVMGGRGLTEGNKGNEDFRILRILRYLCLLLFILSVMQFERWLD